MNDIKYHSLKVDDVLSDIYISYSPYRASYVIRIGFYSTKKKKLFISHVLIGDKKVLINKELNLNYELSNGIFTADLVDSRNEGIILISETEIFEQVKSKQLTITIHFVVDGKEKNISIDMEQYTVRDIVWPT